MTDDIEARLRAALDAYADQVEDRGGVLPAVAVGPGPSGARRRWRGALLAAAAVAAALGGGWWIGPGSPGGDVVVGSAEVPSPEAGAPGAASAPESAGGDTALGAAPGASAAVPGSGLPADPQVGASYAIDLSTHCGVLGTDIGGRWFAADPPLVDGAGGPPAGWENPFQRGTLTLTSPMVAVFTDGQGHDVVLRAAPESARPAPCD